MNKVIEFLNTASRHYYNGSPIIADDVFDRLAESVDYANVGAKQHEDEEEHYRRMYSLDKYYEDENTNKPLSGYKDVTMSPKIDGAAVSHLYINDVYVRSLTRGDGVTGRVVTDKFMNSKLIPMQLKTGLPVVQITGEIAAPKHVENSRNYAAGALNLGSIDEFRTRSVEFFAYGVYPYLSEKFDTDMAILESFGFSTVFSKNIAEIYPTDGLVFRINNNADFEEAGYTAKHPKGAYAKKERGQAVETTLLAVEWGVGKSGKVTPVAILEPVFIGDKQVTRATLNNPAFIESLDIRIGDRVGVILGGEIIPVITHKVSG